MPFEVTAMQINLNLLYEFESPQGRSKPVKEGGVC